MNYKTKVKIFEGYTGDVETLINDFLKTEEENGNNINIISQSQSSKSRSNEMVLTIFYKEDIKPMEEKLTTIDWSGFPDSTRIQKQEFTIRKEVLNIPNYYWEKIKSYHGEDFKITVFEFWKMMGKHGGFLTAKLNPEERDFCDLYYKHIRKEDGFNGDANSIFNK